MFLLWARVEGKQVYFEGFSSTGGEGASPAMQPDGRAGVGRGHLRPSAKGGPTGLVTSGGRLARPRFSSH